MPFFGFLGGVVLTALLVVVYQSRALIARRLGSLEPHRLPPLVYVLGLAYALLFIVMWFAFFDAAWERTTLDDPNAGVVRIGRSLLARMESWDFIVTLLAFITGVLALAATRNVSAIGSATGGPAPPLAKGGQTATSSGFFAELMSQLRRVTALNMMLAFVLVLITLPAVLPWAERRLDSVKVGSVEARFAPLAENTRRSGTPDTPTLATNRYLANYMTLSVSVDRITDVIDNTPGIVRGDARAAVAAMENYQQALNFFNVLIIPRVARLKCMVDFADVRVSDVPGTREAALAFLSTLREVRDDKKETKLAYALGSLEKIDSHFYSNYYYLSEACANKFNGDRKIFDASLTPIGSAYARRVSGSFRGDPCTKKEGPTSCLNVLKNGYVVRFILEFIKISSPYQNSDFLGEVLESGDVDFESYDEFDFTELDKFNIQLLKAGYVADLPYDTGQVLTAYAKVREIAAGFLNSVSETCGSCPAIRRPKPGLEDAYEGYRPLMERYVDAEAVGSIGAAMLRRLPLNEMHGPEAALLEVLLKEASRSRDKILNAEEMSNRKDTWAAAILDEGIATIRYVQLVEDPDRSALDIRETCLAIEERLRRSVKLFRLLQTKDSEHRIDRMRVERTLYLAEQVCD